MPDHPHPASVTPSRSPAISESPPGRPLRAAGQRSGARRCTPSPAANVESTRQGTRRLQRYISGTLRAHQQVRGAGQVSPSRAARGAIATDGGAATANPPTGRHDPGAARAVAKTAGWRMTPSSAFPADTGHTAPGASTRGSVHHQRGRRSTRKPDLTAHVEPEHAAGTAPSVAVRKTADGAHRPSWGTDPVRYTSVDTATQRPPARQGDTSRDSEETARIAENSQLADRFPGCGRCWVRTNEGLADGFTDRSPPTRATRH
jgi:hypothetical protein